MTFLESSLHELTNQFSQVSVNILIWSRTLKQWKESIVSILVSTSNSTWVKEQVHSPHGLGNVDWNMCSPLAWVPHTEIHTQCLILGNVSFPFKCSGLKWFQWWTKNTAFWLTQTHLCRWLCSMVNEDCFLLRYFSKITKDVI